MECCTCSTASSPGVLVCERYGCGRVHPRKVAKMIRGLEHLFCVESERTGVVQPEEEGSGETLLQPFNK